MTRELPKGAKRGTSIAEFLDRSPKPRRGYTIVRLQVPKGVKEGISTYAASAKLEESEVFVKLLEFGLGLPRDQEFASLRLENQRIRGKLDEADIRLGGQKLEAYENLMENKALAARLASLLSENKLVRERMGPQPETARSRNQPDLVAQARHFLSKYTFEPKL